VKISEIAKILDVEFSGADVDVSSVSPIDDIAEGSIVPVFGKEFPEGLASSPAGAFLAKEGAELPDGVSAIISPDPEIALITVMKTLHPEAKKAIGIHPKAFVADSAKLGESVSVGAGAYVGEDCVVGDNTVIYPNAYIGDGASLGDDCLIYANTTIYDGCTLKDRVIVHSNSAIGSDGFGYYQRKGQNIKIPHIGSVVLEDDVEIGSNTSVDKGKFSDTVIGRGTKIDNLVQVAHNVIIGENCIMAGQSAIAGSSTVGDNVMFGGRAAAKDHVHICSKTILGGGCSVISNIEKPGIYAGFPHNSRKSWMREMALVRDLPEIVKRIAKLEKEND